MREGPSLPCKTPKNGNSSVSVVLHLQPWNSWGFLRFGINAIQLIQLATSLVLKILFQELYGYKSIWKGIKY